MLSLLLAPLCGCAAPVPQFSAPPTPTPADLVRGHLVLPWSDRVETFAAMLETVGALGWTVAHRDGDLGLLRARTPAGVPLEALLNATENGLRIDASSPDAAALGAFLNHLQTPPP